MDIFIILLIVLLFPFPLQVKRIRDLAVARYQGNKVMIQSKDESRVLITYVGLNEKKSIYLHKNTWVWISIFRIIRNTYELLLEKFY